MQSGFYMFMPSAKTIFRRVRSSTATGKPKIAAPVLSLLYTRKPLLYIPYIPLSSYYISEEAVHLTTNKL
ncbi:hypothetical protein CGZ60_00680 [Neisseria animalis]|nr:hypothetical protein CGZ60_00680 [Neisseria animalis]